jgi:ribose-phosphate pyrophosphokinase
MKLCLTVDALRGMGTKRINVRIPYIPYGRQDRRCNEGESFSLKVFANILNSLKLDNVETLDTHSDVTSALIDNLEVISNQGLVDWAIHKIGQDNGKDLTHLNVLSPDAGQSKKIYKLFKDYPDGYATLYECGKFRDLKTTEIVESRVPLVPGPEPILIIDDLCDGGRTFIEIAKRLRIQGNENELYLVVSHGIFSHGETELDKYFKRIYTTNSISDSESTFIQRMKVI